MSAAGTPPESARKRALSTVLLAILLDLVGFGMLLPLLPFYAEQFHVSAAAIGLMFSSYSLAQLFCAPLLGRLSDRFGRRPLMLASIAGSVAAYLLFWQAGSFAVLVLARTLSGVAASNYGIAQAYVADITPPAERSRKLGLVGAAFGLGFVLGPLLGLAVRSLGGGAAAVPVAAAALSAINLAIAALWLEESLSPEVRGRSRQTSWLSLGSLSWVWRNAPLRSLMLLFFLVMFCFSVMEATLALYGQARLGLGELETYKAFAYIGVVLVVVQGGLLRRLVKRYGDRRLILSGIVLMMLGLALLPSLPTVWMLLVALGFLAVGSAVHNPSALALLSRLTAAESQGEMIGVSRSFGALARVLGPAAGTWIFGRCGPRLPFWTAGTLMLVALVIGWDLLRRVDESHEVPAGAAPAAS
ncbi:MAG TPA: MFS transporter [Thermoanaerobaculia bacterium]